MTNHGKIFKPATWTCALILAIVTAFPAVRQKPDPVYTIAYAGFGPVKTNLFVASGDGENAKPLLTNPDIDYNASFSRDGTWIVFTSHRGGSADIFRVHPNGSGLERLTTDPAFDDQGVLSPDGRSLAFVSTRGGRANLWIMDVTTRKLKNLTSNSTGDFRPAWSPDGEWIAFSSDRESPPMKMNFGVYRVTQVYVMRRDGSNVRRVSATSGTAGSPAWSPDGSKIAFYEAPLLDIPKILAPLGAVNIVVHDDSSRARMRIISVDWRTGKSEVLDQQPGEKWSPQWISSRQVGYVSGGPSGGIERTDGPAGSRGEFSSPSWSPDRQVLVFHRETDSAWPPFRQMDTRNGGFQLIRTGIFPSYSPSGNQLVSNSARAGILHNSILIMNADGTSRRVLFDDAQKSALAPVWSPVGDRIAFALGEFFSMASGREGVISQLAILNADGTGFRLLTTAGSHAGFPSWSPDGRRLVYRSNDKSGRGLWIIDVATQSVTELTNGSHNDNFPAWSPMGNRIAFTSDRDGDYEIYTIRPDGKSLRRLTRSRGNDAHLAWSPDGKWIAFTSARTGFTDEILLHPGNVQADGEIFVMRADGSDVRRLTENQFEDGTAGWKP